MSTRGEHLKSAKFRIEGAMSYYDMLHERGEEMSEAEYDQHVLLMMSSLTSAVDSLGGVLYKGAMIRRDKESRGK